ncbi:VIT domain-containing protein [Flavobacterium sp. TN-1]|uniref:VIT domain-containing protein n=1 Tax=Flavobacterium TaxID=237 RepID=UPI000A9ABECA|nr:VIT domain-containing protein [Flavobacterium covae]
MFKKSFLFILLFISLYSWAQNPQLTVKDKDSSLVKLSQLKVQVKIVGNIAYTTTEMHFFNASTRPMEADLLFPLPEGISVSRYAIDINGKIREAVPVNKNKGKQVFEAVEHRRVDPGLLEKVEGNNFKTRIFPLLPNSERIVIIGYEQELSMLDKTYLGYQMMSSYTKAIDTFELNISVIGSDAQPKISNDGKEITIEKLGTTYQASIQQKNYIPKDKLLVKIPVTSSIPSVVTQEKDNQYYFYATMHLDGAKKAKTLPKSIGLIWDVSLSSHKRDSKKELELLDLYFKKMPSVAVSLYLAGFHFEKKADYVISNGNWSELRKTLETITYDCGTNYTKIELPKKDEILFFTDGLSTLSDATLPETKQPLYTITSSVTANYAFLNYQAIKTGGAFLNLNTLKTEDALTLLTHRNFLFYGIKNNNTVVETYPMEGTPVTPNFSVAGISLLPTNQVTLLFGYDAEHLTEQTLTIATNKETNTDLNIEKLWAQKKIANLEIQYNKNAEEIETLGKKFGIITPNTSLIVLETVNDYILYDIVPPAELREEFDKIKKTQLASTEAKTKSNWENIDRYHSELDNWWKKNIKFVKKKEPKPIKNKKNIRHTTNLQPNPTGLEKTVTGSVSDQHGPLPGAVVKIKGTNRNAQTGFDGSYSIKARNGDVLVIEFIGMTSREVRINNNSSYNVTLEDNGQQLSEVVVSGYSSNSPSPSTVREAKEDLRVTEEIKDKAISENESRSATPQQGFFQQGYLTRTDTIDSSNTNTWSNANSIKTNSWNPDRVYLKALEKVAPAEKYALYLKLREVNQANPSYYFDVATHFYNTGETEKALLVLSNIAELDLENHQLYKSLLFVLRQWGANELALHVAKKIAMWRAHEPQSYRDLALTLEDNKQYQEAYDTLLKALETNYYGEMSGVYEGIEDIILMDINRLAATHNINTGKLDKKYVDAKPLDLRIILNWNQMDTDIDLHIIEPTNEECYYAHKDTEIGARFSKDFTQGYGPEQYLLRNAIKGKYQIKTNYYGETKLTETGPATVLVEIYIKDKNGKIVRKLQTIQLGKVKENQNLAEITID